ncbi:RNA methyltransferase [Thiospirillum jenense]|uniref:tRNA (cytidine/uridine-2'-O-)-methyltransferase TrmJ n=1 Tax=Thiospirillum jenense TaxID=1653858 RepID=A0A839HDN1_9GAMM|nr:RNA methyltransferase [Thiospirillum jenense]MBB1125358.1 RNA methyltransferase [Thiospirillum jenense]
MQPFEQQFEQPIKQSAEQIITHLPTELVLQRIRFVLVATSLSGNIGAVARAMKTMGLSRLALVQPQHFPDADAVARAAGADDLLAQATVHSDLTTALTGCRLIIGASARRRSLHWPTLTPETTAQQLLTEAAAGEVALVLGRENSGLTNDELAQCHYLVQIPTNPAFSSLNLGAAAQVFAYEIHRIWLAMSQTNTQITCAETVAPAVTHNNTEAIATAEEMAGFFAHLDDTLIQLGFAKSAHSATLRRRLRRLFNRARPDRVEINILRGILRAATKQRRVNAIRDHHYPDHEV